MNYIYVLLSEKDGHFYTGSTNDLQRRIKEHNSGKANSTKNRRPLELIYYEACKDEADAIRREKYLKTSWGKQYLNKRLTNSLKSKQKEACPVE